MQNTAFTIRDGQLPRISAHSASESIDTLHAVDQYCIIYMCL